MSKWEKLLQRILSLSKDLRFDELRKVLETTATKCFPLAAAVVTIPSASPAASQSPFLSMSPLRKYMSKWFAILLKVRRIVMKTLEQYMALPYPLEIIPDSDEGGFVGSYPDLPGCLTCGETMEDVVRNAEDAKRAWLTAALEEGLVIHEPNLPTAYSGQFKLRIPKSLHRSLAEHSRSEGISMNQYCLYLLAKNDALYGA